MAADLVRLPRPAAGETLEQLFGEAAPSRLVLHVRIRAEGAPAREFGHYLMTVDRLYGRTDPKGLRSYSNRSTGHLEVSGVQHGSIEVLFEQALSVIDQHNLVFLWLLLRGLPGAARLLAQTVKTYTGAYRDYEEGRLARSRRLRIDREDADQRREKLRLRAGIRGMLLDDPELKTLPPERRNQVARFLASIYAQDPEAIRRAGRFAESFVEDLKLDSEE